MLRASDELHTVLIVVVRGFSEVIQLADSVVPFRNSYLLTICDYFSLHLALHKLYQITQLCVIRHLCSDQLWALIFAYSNNKVGHIDGKRRLEREADYLLETPSEFTNAWRFASTPLFAPYYTVFK
jgi:hypothetical protein